MVALDVSSPFRRNGEGDREAVEGLLPTRQTVQRARDLRRRMTPPELRLWVRLRREQLRGLKFRRQHPIGPFILDFGQSHDHPDRAEHDRRRTRWLHERGLRVIRLAAEDVRVNLHGVLEFIARVANERRGG